MAYTTTKEGQGASQSPTLTNPSHISFILHWCDIYGLSENSARYLLAQEFTSGDTLLAMNLATINALQLPLGQKCLLRGSILQYRDNRRVVDANIRKRDKPIWATMKKKKTWESIMVPEPDENGSPYANMSSKELMKLTAMQKAAILEMRRRLHKRRKSEPGNCGGSSLADRILRWRDRAKDSSNGTNSLMRSQVSVQSSPAVMTKYTTILPPEPETSHTPSSESAESDSESDVLGKEEKEKKSVTSEATDTTDLDDTLRELENIGKPGLSPESNDDYEPDQAQVEKSRAEADEAIRKLEEELFTADEQDLVDEAKRQQESEKNLDDQDLDNLMNGNFEEELDGLIQKQST